MKTAIYRLTPGKCSAQMGSAWSVQCRGVPGCDHARGTGCPHGSGGIEITVTAAGKGERRNRVVATGVLL